jgi:alpha-L-fucosidase 2
MCVVLLTTSAWLHGQKAALQQNKLWYTQPANVWEEALPLGNSRLGAMVYGKTAVDEIQLNEETIWGGGPYTNNNPKALNVLEEVRQLIFDGKNRQAEDIINQNFFTRTHGMPYQTAGNFFLHFEGHNNVSDYYRELDIANAVTTTRYKHNGVTFVRRTIASFSDDVIIMHISANKKGAITFDLDYKSRAPHKVGNNGKSFVVYGQGTDHEGIKGEVRYQIHAFAKNKGGNVRLAENKLSVMSADEVTLYISVATNFTNYKSLTANEGERAAQKLDNAIKLDFKKALKAHSAIYAQQFNRFSLHLGQNADAAKLPTNERIANFSKTQDPSLVTLLAQFGRYLLISSSQPGGQPANLQGIWANSLTPPWDSKYTININAEMNYWPAEITNLSETHEPFLRMVKEVAEAGAQTAAEMYGAKGWVAHHNTDVWRVTSPIDFAAAGMWPTGGAWIAQHLWERYLFTGDKKFLQEVYPVLKGAADFFLTSMVKHPQHNWMVVSPSVSPEHGPISAGCTMDNQLVYDVLSRTAMAIDILGGDKQYQQQVLDLLNLIPPMQIGKHTQLQEWLQDIDDPKNEHRHVSHLYGLYPGNQISPYKTPTLFEAARNSLIYRGDLATGWSIGWKVNLWARLLDGDHAYKIINNMLTIADGGKNSDGRTYPNMFTAHPPFQIDGNFGLTAGVAEMLLQSHDDAIHILPALPKTWPKGSVNGIVARGGYVLGMDWENEQIKALSIFSKNGGKVRIRSYVPLKAKGLMPAVGPVQNHLLASPEVPSPIVSPNANLKGLQLKKVYEYDLETVAGKSYSIKSSL